MDSQGINTNRELEHIQISSIPVTTLISPRMALLLTLGQGSTHARAWYWKGFE